MHDAELQAIVDRINLLVEEFDAHPDDAVRQLAFELLQHVDTLHREGLSRLAGMLRAAGQGHLIERLAEDPAVRLLMMLYDLIPTAAEGSSGPAGTASAAAATSRRPERRGFVPLQSIGIGAPVVRAGGGERHGDEERGAADRGTTASKGAGQRMLVAGIGNVLRGDDGFGPAVAAALGGRELPPGTEVIETGIGGLHLVQQLMGRDYAALVIVDAVDRGGPPGHLWVLDAEVPDPRQQPEGAARPLEIDVHQADPSRILLMARALDVLPSRVRIVGCQPGSTDLEERLSAPVQGAVEKAAETISALLWEWNGGHRTMDPAVEPGGRHG